MTTACRTAKFVTAQLRWAVVIAFALAFSALRPGGSNQAQGVIDQIYTLPFEGQYSVGQCFSQSHKAIDYTLSDPATGGHPVLAASRGTAMRCALSQTAGEVTPPLRGD